MRVKDFQNIQVACELMETGLRLPLVNSLAGIESRRLLRSLWNEIHGHSPSSGKLPNSVISYIKDYQSAAELSAFVALYKSLYTNQTDTSNYLKTGRIELRPWTLLETWKEYKKLTGICIDINAGYYAVRDVIFKIVLYTACSTCTANFIYDPSKRYTERCPFCKTLYVT